MDLSWLVDHLDGGPAAAVGGLVIGALFGALAQRSRFCLRSAVIELIGGRTLSQKMVVWLLTFTAAVAGTQLLVTLGYLDTGEARQLAGRGSMSGALIGGAMFGVGMILTRGCASRLLVLSANGNLRALLSGLVFAVVAQTTLRGMLAPVRDRLAGLWTIDDSALLDLSALLGIERRTIALMALVGLAAIVALAFMRRVPSRIWLSAIGVGLMVAVGWLFTYSLAQQSFDIIQVESLSFTGPSADTLMLVLSPFGQAIDFDVGLVPGVFLGSFLAAWLTSELKLEGFRDGESMRRYIIGAALMGMGGMMAGGCAVGAGVTGAAVMASIAWVTLLAIWIAAGLTHLLLDARAEQGPVTSVAGDQAAGEKEELGALGSGGLRA